MAGLPDENLIELLLHPKKTTPEQAKLILNSQPQVSYALMDLMVMIDAVNMEAFQPSVHPNIHRSPGGTTHEFTWDHPRRLFFRDNGEYYGPEKAENGAIGPVTTRGSKPNASREAASKREGRQLEKRRGEGKCSKLPDMPLDILYGSHMFTFVPPTDLLLVPWTNKAVGNVLAKESPRHAWIASVDNITVSQRLPECLAQLIRKSGSVHRRRCVKPRGAVEQDTLKIHSNERSWPGLT